jgi:hypothetical protein
VLGERLGLGEEMKDHRVSTLGLTLWRALGLR